jgi:hypothetical protein
MNVYELPPRTVTYKPTLTNNLHNLILNQRWGPRHSASNREQMAMVLKEPLGFIMGMAGTGTVWEIPTRGYTVPVTAVSWCHTGTIFACCHGFQHIVAHCVLIPQYCGYFMGKSQ